MGRFPIPSRSSPDLLPIPSDLGVDTLTDRQVKIMFHSHKGESQLYGYLLFKGKS